MKRIKTTHSVAAFFLLLIGAAAVDAQPVLSLQPGVSLSWPTATNDTYQPEWSPVSASSWNPLGGLIPGNGATNSLYDPAPSGSRSYQVLEMVPGILPPSPNPVLNPGFETAGASSSLAANWTVDTAAGGPVYGVRTNDNPHLGASNFEVYLASVGGGPVVEFNQGSIPVTGGTAYPFTFYAAALTGSTGYNAQWRIVWNAGGDTGYQTFTPGTATTRRSATPSPLPLARPRRPFTSILPARHR